jgi:hypothetical protein
MRSADRRNASIWLFSKNILFHCYSLLSDSEDSTECDVLRLATSLPAIRTRIAPVNPAA